MKDLSMKISCCIIYITVRISNAYIKTKRLEQENRRCPESQVTINLLTAGMTHYDTQHNDLSLSLWSRALLEKPQAV
jgi:hypothetical protein